MIVFKYFKIIGYDNNSFIMSHEEIPIMPGVYITNYRKNAHLVGIKQPQQPPINDVGILLEECHALESKSKKLQQTIQEIKKEKNWEQDRDYRQAIEQNWVVLIKFCDQLKQKAQRLAELKYQPETTKIQQLINLDRIQKQKAHAKAELDNIKRERQEKLQKEKQQQQQEQQESSEGMYL